MIYQGTKPVLISLGVEITRNQLIWTGHQWVAAQTFHRSLGLLKQATDAAASEPHKHPLPEPSTVVGELRVVRQVVGHRKAIYIELQCSCGSAPYSINPSWFARRKHYCCRECWQEIPVGQRNNPHLRHAGHLSPVRVMPPRDERMGRQRIQQS
ncbi:hypothetical protein [Pseudomonas sp.]|uniref:hypothetical protein n=1 Tax=Pseudomonas sp. TaxID=306 RepID=UPI003F2F80AB